MYEDWDKRPADLSQARIVAALRERLQSIRKAQFEVLIPPPIPGLGQAGGFQMMVEDRTGVGLGALEKAAQQILLAAEKEPGLRGVMTTFNSKSPQLQLRIDRTMVESLGVTMNDVFQSRKSRMVSQPLYTRASRRSFCGKASSRRKAPCGSRCFSIEKASLDFTTVLTAEQNLYQAQNNFALATGSIALGLITTYRALGGGWQIREGRDFVPAETQREMAERTNWGTLLTPDLLRPDAPGLPSPEDRAPPVRLPEW